MREKVGVNFLLVLGTGLLAALIWWLLFTRTALLLFFFAWPATWVAPPQSNLDTVNKIMLDIVIFGGLALLLSVIAVIVCLYTRHRQAQRSPQRGQSLLIIASCIAFFALILLLCTLCGTSLSTFFYFN